MKLKDILKDLRIKNNLTLDELAERLNKYDGVDISKGTISRWENGTREPKNTYVSAYAKEFNIDLNILYGLEEYSEEPKDDNQNFKEMVVMGFDGLDVTKLSEEERKNYYNDLINMMEMVNLKYKNKGNK
ncbi:helix-turn-helix domain-containing protein [Helcococcus kunzii]|uniref:helix-turn-helix domain-containing protein n=1 Tax=Helcococcus kunzii TaxID=40091 RepID=UPI001BAE7A2B|nr:helix-turn-helix transcriptional regulator [Helcococcus kunzii]QUY65123.1 helix-turn-helix transcriptional regulator [Helcococcus kunzii]